MIIEGQKVLVRWNGNNRHIYEPIGYVFTKHGEEFEVNIKDLPKHSIKEVSVKCDGCGEYFKRAYSSLNRHNSNIHYCSNDCKYTNNSYNFQTYNNKRKMSKDERVNKCIEELIKLKDTLGKIPTVYEYDDMAKDKGLLRRRNLEKNLGINWANICKKYLGDTNKDIKSKDQLLLELNELKDKLGRTPLARELIGNETSDLKTFMRKFDMTYNELVESLGWDLTGHKSIWKSDEELISDYIALYKKLNRIPHWDDIRNENNMAGADTYRFRIGNLFKICELAEIEFDDTEFSKIGFGSNYINKKGDICLSFPELIITNLFIDNNINYIKEYRYSDAIKSDNTKRRFDWYLPDYNIFIEYFGLFNISQLGKDNWLGRYTQKALDKINLCSINNLRLIDFYPDDLNNDFEGIKNKLNRYITFNIESVS